MPIELMILLAVVFCGVSIGWFIFLRNQRKRREAHDAEIRAASEAASKRPRMARAPISAGPYFHGAAVGGNARMRSAMASTAPQPTMVQDNSNPLIYGALGYMLASSGNGHASDHRHEPTPDLSCRPSDGNYGGAGASASYESSSSSDSSSSYDSGSSSSDSSSSSSSSSD